MGLQNQTFPVLQPCDLIHYLAAKDQIGRLCGAPEATSNEVESMLLVFWRRYSRICPGHQVFNGSVQLRRSIPCYIHGDDGRSFKKSGVLLINLQGALGAGSAPFHKKHKSRAEFMTNCMGLNIGGHSYGSRLLYYSMQRKFFAKQPEVFDHLLDNLANQLLKLQQGFTWGNDSWHIIVLGVKGDLPWLTKAGGFQRHFLRAQRVRNPKEPPAGICFLCHAGRSQVPYEDFRDDALWVPDGCDLPWARQPSLLKLYHDPDCPSSFYKLDIFHNFHGGAGKDWVASVMTEALGLLPGNSKDAKIEAMAAIMREWGKPSRDNRPHSGDFCADRIGLTSYQVCPDASWSKHNDTTIYMRFIQFFFAARPEHREDPRMCLMYQATCAINLSFELLYEGGLWLPREIAAEAARLGRFWVQAYGAPARQLHAAQLLRFPLHTKLHYLNHSYRFLQYHAASSEYVYNIRNESVQQDEVSWRDV